jgi:glycosyltransferase involved in cell wall biosynthesis
VGDRAQAGIVKESDRPLRILQVATSDLTGGAERSAVNLHRAFRALGNESWLAVGLKRTADPDVLEIPNERQRNAWVRWWNHFREHHAASLGRVRGIGRLTALLRDFGTPMRWMHEQMGIEDFAFPGTELLLDIPPVTPDILHCHNLHGGYFDLRALPRLSERVPTILNLRDAWLLSGHCAYSFECERWKHGCGKCPDLTLYPAVRRDATAYNWRRKQGILGSSRVFVTTPSQWLMDRVRDSILTPAIIESRVIPNAVDTSIFFPGDKAAARADLRIPDVSRVLMFASNGIRANVWKDYRALNEAMRILGSDDRSRNLILLAVGETAPSERVGNAEIRFIPFQKDPASLARYYRAADIYAHAARIESFGNVLLEARACGTPVVAMAVGGIPEHVRSLDCADAVEGVRAYSPDEATGVLTKAGSSEALAKGILFLLDHAEIARTLGENAVRDVNERFQTSIQARRFLVWYREILAARNAEPTGSDKTFTTKDGNAGVP